jgi:PBSX family phage portal protein
MEELNESPEVGVGIQSLKSQYSDTELMTHAISQKRTSQKINKRQMLDNIPGNQLHSITTNDLTSNMVMEPEYPPHKFKQFYDISDTLRTCITAYETNINGFGYEFIPAVDITTYRGKKVRRQDKRPVPVRILSAIEKERARLTMFFKTICLDNTWTMCQKLKRRMLEIYGNAYLEIERDAEGNIIGANVLESEQMKLTKHEKKPVIYKVKVLNPVTHQIETIERGRRFRKYVPDVSVSSGYNDYSNSKPIYFKEFGDPRLMDACSGITYPADYPVEELPPGFVEATEIIHYKITDPGNIHGYGIPRWISLMPVMLGIRSSDLVNFELLKNKGIPDLIMMVEGAKAGSVRKRIEDQIKENKKFGKLGSMLIVEVEQSRSGHPGTDVQYKMPTIKVEALSELLTKEGMFMEFQKHGSERITSLFRLANLFIGKTNDLNRATAEVAKQITEEQVFMPERIDDDDITNNFVLTDMGIRYHTYRSKSKKLENPSLIASILNNGALRGGFLPQDVRRIGSELINRPLEDIDETFMEKPLNFSVVELQNQFKADPSSEPVAKNWMKLEQTEDSEVLNNIVELLTKHYKIDVGDLYLVNTEEHE